MVRLQPRKSPQKSKESMDRSFLPVIFGNKCLEKELTTKDEKKLTLFEKSLGSSISKSDTIDLAIDKIVRTALACEFGPTFVLSKEAQKMIKTISHGIVSDTELRKQALIILDRFADQRKPKVMNVPSTRKAH